MSKLKSYQEQIQESIDKGISTFEDQYRNLMARPFSFAEKAETKAKNLSVRNLREKHDQAVDNVSDSLRNFNKKLNQYVADVLARIEGNAEKAAENVKESQPAQAASKKAASAKAKAEEKAQQVKESA